MTYGELSNAKTFGFETNHIIDDAVNNARFSYGKKFWESQEVSDHDLNQIGQFAKREGVAFPLAPSFGFCSCLPTRSRSASATNMPANSRSINRPPERIRRKEAPCFSQPFS
jgi:hypothetical protein